MTSPVVCFLDESGTDDKVTDDGIVGGILLNRIHIPAFDTAWNAMLGFHGVRLGLHMRAFGPGGDNAHIVGADRAMLFTSAVRLINEFKIMAMGVSVKNRRREKAFSTELQERLLSSYGLAFMMCVAFHAKSAAHQGYSGKIDFVLDAGNDNRSHVEKIHRITTENTGDAAYQLGSLTFASDDSVPALQAADIIAWATRRRRSGGQFRSAFAPLLGLFNGSYIENHLSDGTLDDLSSRFAAIEAQVRAMTESA